MSVSSIITGLKSVISTTLPTYKELNFGVEITDNVRSFSQKRYSVIAHGSSETASRTREVTVDQKFTITLTDNYTRNPVEDTSKQAVINSLHDIVLSLYASIVNQKAGAPANVMIVNNLALDDFEDVKDKELIIFKMNFNIRHRMPL